ncbi:MAG: hypothetical protein IPJ07_03230 [Acidobacteria bacterium]|nr:hypothetical protein [Acidobacteriota bacterium]
MSDLLECHLGVGRGFQRKCKDADSMAGNNVIEGGSFDRGLAIAENLFNARFIAPASVMNRPVCKSYLGRRGLKTGLNVFSVETLQRLLPLVDGRRDSGIYPGSGCRRILNRKSRQEAVALSEIRADEAGIVESVDDQQRLESLS